MAGGCNKCGAKATPDGDRLMKCPGECKAMYCSKECQQDDWMSHKRTCASFQSNKCWICKKSSKEASPLYRACACRGDKGFGHIECFIRYAKMIDKSAFLECPVCHCVFRDEIQEALLKENEQELLLSEAFHSLVGDSDRQMACKLQRGKELSMSEHQNTEEALECFEEVFDHYRVKYGEEDMLLHKVGADAAICIAQEKRDLDHFDEALELLTRVERVMHSGRVSADWQQVIDCRLDATFESIYTALERYTDALPYAERTFESCERNPEARIDAKIISAHRLSNIYLHLFEFEKALPLGMKAYKLSKKAFGPNDPMTEVTKERLEAIEEGARMMRG